MQIIWKQTISNFQYQLVKIHVRLLYYSNLIVIKKQALQQYFPHLQILVEHYIVKEQSTKIVIYYFWEWIWTMSTASLQQCTSNSLLNTHWLVDSRTCLGITSNEKGHTMLLLWSTKIIRDQHGIPRKTHGNMSIFQWKRNIQA